MIDTIIYIDTCNITIIFTHRGPVSLYSSTGHVLDILTIILSPISSSIETYSQWVSSQGDTDKILL